MAIKIELVNCALDQTKITPEESAALEIKKQFEKEFAKYPEAKGTLYILRSLSIFGYKVRDIDLVLIGYFDNFVYKSKVKTKNFGEVKGLHIDSLICNIELKDIDNSLDCNGDPRFRKIATSYWYRYAKSGDKDITAQAFDQMNSFVNYLRDNFSVNPPFMSDMIWFRSLSRDTLDQVRCNEKDNALSSDFAFKDWINVFLLRQNVSIHQDRSVHLDSFNGHHTDIKVLTKKLCEPRYVGGLTKVKFEILSQAATNIDPIKANAGNKFSIITGRAGTGKTMQLLQTAVHLSKEENKRVLLLTYNNALVSDIRRILDYSDIPVSFDERTVSIKSVDSFFIHLMKAFGIIKDDQLIPTDRQYRQKFDKALEEFYDLIVKDLEEKDVPTIKELASCPIDWDNILIDEGQDWPDLHKKVLFKLYGPQRLIVADGVDQFMMSSKKQEWTDSIDSAFVFKPAQMKVNLRQKSNLVEFLNALSSHLRLGWRSTKNKDLLGGKVEVYSKYDSTIHKDLQDHCNDSKCESYDILMLVPPSYVTTEVNGTSHFETKKAESYKKAKIEFFDGTNSSNRHRYSSPDKARLFQYDSCRGLEGWVTVCQRLDELVEHKMSHIDKDEIKKTYPGLSIDEGIKKYVYTWVLMPLTRPVDRLVITLKDPESEIGRVLKELSESYEFVEWHIK